MVFVAMDYSLFTPAQETRFLTKMRASTNLLMNLITE